MRTIRRLCWIALAALLVAPLAGADAPQTGVVTGIVKGPDGAPMPGATVQLTGEQGAMTAVTGADGKFRFVFLAPGAYTARADLEGFQAAAGEISVSAGGRADVELSLGEVMGEEILVTGEAPLVDRYDMTSGGTIDSQELLAITGQGQQYRSRLLFLPGVFNDPTSDEYGGNRPVISGIPGQRQMYFIDGVDVSFSRWGGGSQLNLPETAVAEMKLESTGADAQYSRAIGAFTQTTVRSGTNDLHGAAWYQMQNLAWNADNENIDDSARSDEIEDGIDVSLGGPIARDKLWFFLAYRDYTTPGYALMADGVSVVSEFVSGGAQLAKLDWRPSADHSLSGVYVLTPSDFPWWNRGTGAGAIYADLATVSAFEYPGDIATLTWNWAISDSLLLTVKGATTTAEQNREAYSQPELNPACNGVTPCGNHWVYQPFTANAAYPNAPFANMFVNGVGLPLGEGYTNFPRDQANAALEWFVGSNDIKAGVDYQEVTWDVAGLTVPLCRGRDFGYDVPGGFRSNQNAAAAQRGFCRFYPTKATWQNGWGPATSSSESIALYVRDKISLDRWTFNLGVRADQQTHQNDAGATVLDNTSVAPRFAVSWDLSSDSTFVLNATAGRYYAQVEQAWAAYFNVTPQGRTQYEEYIYNPATRDYDIFSRVVTGGSGLGIVEVSPYYKDEYSAGAEWQFHPDWALKVNAYYWKAENYPQVLDQINEAGALYQVVENTADAYTQRGAVDITLQRRFKNGWMVAASYTYSKTTGNCDYLENGPCNAFYGELLDFTRGDGVPWSTVNRDGRTPEDRPNVFKLRGAYNWRLGKGHSINVGGLAYYNDGQLWVPWLSLNHPTLGTTGSVAVFGESLGDRRTDPRKQLDLNLQWSFPIAGQLNGFIRSEILNVLDDQVQIGTAGMDTSCAWNLATAACTGTPTPVLTNANFQTPRTIRLQVGLNF